MNSYIFNRDKLIEGLKHKEFKQIIIMTGAGISVSAGIPDFRSPKTGIYSNLEKYNLPNQKAIFDIDYFREKPEAFYDLAKSFLDMSKYDATLTHNFCKLLIDKNIVKYYLTQNIDNLELKANIDPQFIIKVHGPNTGAECSLCDCTHERDQLNKYINQGKVMRCRMKGCRGPVKPDITFFGEQVATEFMDKL